MTTTAHEALKNLSASIQSVQANAFVKDFYRRYPSLSKIKPKVLAPDDQSRDRRAYHQARSMSDDPAERAEMVAIHVGKTAKREGIPLKTIQWWLQGAYGSVWVKESGLNPGMDLKDLFKIITKVMR